MDLVGWVGAGIVVVDGVHAQHSQGVGQVSGDAGELPECKVMH